MPLYFIIPLQAAFLIVFSISFWVVPIRLARSAVRKKGLSPRWLLFGIYPGGAWIVYLVALRAKSRRIYPRFLARESEPISPTSGRLAYGRPLAEDEVLVTNLVPDNVERLYYHRGQVAAVTNKRLLFIQPKQASIAKLQDYYTVESVDLKDIRSVLHGSTTAIGGLFAGLILLLTAIIIAYCGIKGEIEGPGVKNIPYVAAPAGLALIFGLKRRVLRFDAEDWSFDWTSAALELSRTGKEIGKLKALLEHSRIASAGM